MNNLAVLRKVGFFLLLSLCTLASSFAYDIPPGNPFQEKDYKEELSKATDVDKGGRIFQYNNGFFENGVLYRVSHGEARVDFHSDKLAFGLRKVTSVNPTPENIAGKKFSYLRWDIEFLGANTPEVSHKQTITSPISRIMKNTSVTEAIHAKEVEYKNLYDGIDMRFYSSDNEALKYDFILSPHADVRQIQLQYQGIEDLKIVEGELHLQTPWGLLREAKPYSYQIIDGLKKEVMVSYELHNSVLRYKIEGNYDPNHELIIDPIYVDWSTYFYGDGAAQNQSWGGFTWILGADLDDDDNVYITGMTTENYPEKAGFYDSSFNGNYDAFIAKISSKGDSLLYFTYIGGSQWEYAFNLTVNGAGEPVISGITSSSNFPTTSGAYNTSGRNCGTSGTCYNGFVTKLDSSGKSLVFSTYLGGSSGGWFGTDWIRGMTLDASGNVYVVGNTNSTDFPTTSGAYETTFQGTSGGFTNWWNRGDAFLASLSSDGSSLRFGTYIGGRGDEAAYDVEVDDNGSIYVIGTSNSGNFPTTPGARSIFNNGARGNDGFVVKFNSDASRMIFGKLMGGGGDDVFEGIYIDEIGIPYLAGYSNSNDFYTTNGAYQTRNKGGYDFVVVKLFSSGTGVYYSTYLGGSGDEYFFSGPYYSTVKITGNVKGEVFISGTSRSTNFPVTTDALQSTNNSTSSWAQNLTISKLSFGGDKLLYATYYGGSGAEYPGEIKAKRVGCVSFILSTGLTISDDYPTTDSAYRKNSRRTSGTGFYWSGYVTKFRDTLQTEEIDISLTDTVIECDKVFYIADALNRGADYLWSNGSTRRSINIEDTGTFWVRATYGCDTVSDTVTLKLEYSPRDPELGEDSLYCDVFPLRTLDAQNDTVLCTYLWHDGSTTQTVDVDSAGKYWVEINTPNCGSRTDTIRLDFLTSPDVDLGLDSIFCDSVNMTLDARNENIRATYVWSTGDSTQSIFTDQEGAYKVWVENACNTDSFEIVLSFIKTPDVQLPEDSVFCNNVDYLIRGGFANNQEVYQWSNFDESALFGLADSIQLLTPGGFKLKATNKCGESSDSIRIGLLVTPDLDLDTTLYSCDVVNETLTIPFRDNQETYSWQNHPSRSAVRNVNQEGFYKAYATNKCGLDSAEWEIVLKQTPTLNLTEDSVFCDQVNYLFDIPNNDEEMTYLWENGITDSTRQIDAPGSYKLTLSNRCGSFSDSVEFGIIYSPTISLPQDEVFCGFMPVQNLSVGRMDNQEIYLWMDGATNAERDVQEAGVYRVSISNKCGFVEDSVVYRISDIPVVDLGEDTVLCGNFRVQLDAENPGATYLWLPTGETTQVIQATEQTTYEVVVTNADGCEASGTFTIGSGCVSEYYIPTAFSPNEDGLNDVFKPTLVNFEQYELLIFNRWGEVIFRTKDVNQGWDGTYQGAPLEPGIYSYMMRFITTEDGEFQNKNGQVFLIK
jgi:gliding motility-associated-like protein